MKNYCFPVVSQTNKSKEIWQAFFHQSLFKNSTLKIYPL